MFKSTTSASALRSVSRALTPAQTLRNAATRRRMHSQAAKKLTPPNVSTGKLAAAAAASLGALAAYRHFGEGIDVHADVSPPVLVAPAPKMAELSAQHVQIQSSLENPGVYAWGDNSGKVIDPNSDEKTIKTPRRLAFFDGVLLRDLKLDKNVGVAVDSNGDVLQWGTGYADKAFVPYTTLKGKDIKKVELNADKVVALSRDNTVYTFPISRSDQLDGPKLKESSWIPGRSGEAQISYRTIKPDLGYTEKISDIRTGRDHLLLLTTSGRVFTAACSYTYPLKGQLGIPSLTWITRPKDKPYDTPHLISLPSSEKVSKIAAGDYHSVLLTSSGRVFTFGDNLNGQLGFDYHPESDFIDKPKELKLSTLYPEESQSRVTGIAAGGANSYFQVDFTDPKTKRTSADLLSCGTGIYGNLGNGRWTHVQGTPTKIKTLSGLFEYSEAQRSLLPLRPSELVVGATHAAAIMSNVTNTSASGRSLSDTNYGSDVLWWGNNECYQLGTGKRNNSNVPVYIGALDARVIEGVGRNGNGMTGSASKGGNNAGERMSGIIGGGGDMKSGMFTGGEQVHRFQITPVGKTKAGKKARQTVTLGRGNTAVYMQAV